MFKRRTPSNAPHDVYSSSLATSMLCYGYALWRPEPQKTGEPQIGDVGYILEGGFIRFFNLNTSKPEHQVRQFWRKPPFEPAVSLPSEVFGTLNEQRSLLPTGHYRSHGVRQFKLSGSVSVPVGPIASVDAAAGYTCKESQGAVIILNRPAHLEAIPKSVSLRKYIRRHHGEWYDHVKHVLDQDIRRDEVIVVSGYIKTSPDWKVMAFMSSTVGYHGSLGVRALGAGAKLSATQSLESSSPPLHRQGSLFSSRAPSDTTDPDEPIGDQCIFLQRYKAKWRGLRIVAGAGYHELPRDEDGRSGGGMGGVGVDQGEDEEDDMSDFENKHLAFDPLETLLEYILEVSGVEVAIASDDDVRSIVGEKTPIDFSTFLRGLQPVVEVEDGCGTISIVDTMSQQQERAFTHRTIRPSDPYKWPGLSFDGAGRLEIGRAFVGPTAVDSLPVKWKYLVFEATWSSKCSVIATSPDSTLVAASFQDNTALVWRLSDGLLVQHLQEQGHADSVKSIAFSSDSRTLVSGSNDKSAIIWDVRSGRALRRLKGHTNDVASVAYSPDGTFVATGSWDSSLKIWDASSGACLHSLDLGSTVYNIMISADGSRLVARAEYRDLIYDIHTGVPRLLKETPEQQHRNVYPDRIAMSLQGDRVIAAAGKVVEIRSTVTGEQVPVLGKYTQSIRSVAFSPDGSEVVIASLDRTVVVRDSWTGQQRYVLQTPSRPWSVAYSPDGKFIAVGEDEGRIRVYDAKSGILVAELDGHADTIRLVRFLANASSLLSWSMDGTVRMWNVRDILRIW